jgi:hypothetical protein
MGKNAGMAPDEPPPDVLSSLPRTRPQRRSAKRDAAKAAPRKPATAKKAQPTTAKGKPAPKAARARKPAGTGASGRAAPMPAAGFAPPRDPDARPAPSGVELVGTAIQAAGELAQIGLAVGGQALKSALGRLGRS